MVADLLSESSLRTQNIVDPHCVARLVDDHYAQRADFADQLLALVTFQLWSRSYGVA